MSSSTAQAEQEYAGSAREYPPAYAGSGDPDRIVAEGDRRVADREALDQLSKAHWELDGSYYLG